MAGPTSSASKPDFDSIRAAIQNPAAAPKISPLLVLETALWRGTPAPPVLWILAGLLARREAGCLAGRSNVGKGFLVLLFMLSVATGRDMFGRKGTGKPMKAVLVEMEDSPEELHRRINRGLDLMRMDESWTDADETTFWANLTIVIPNWDSSVAKTLPAMMPTIKTLLADLTKDGAEIGLVVLDTFAALSEGDENIVKDQREPLACLYQLRDLTGSCVLAVHHLRKPGHSGKAPGLGERLNFDYVRGSSAIVAAFRFLVQIEALTPSEAVGIGLEEEKAQRGGYAVLATTKVVSGPKGDWVLLEQVEGIGGGFWTIHPKSEELCAQLHGSGAAQALSQDEAVLLSIADGVIDRKKLKESHWPDLTDKRAEMALKGVLQRLRGPRHLWVQPGRSMALTEAGRKRAQQLRDARNKAGNEGNTPEDDSEDDPDM